jgi:hypothetical protein
MQIQLVDVIVKKRMLTCVKVDCPGNYEFDGAVHVLSSNDPTAAGSPTFCHKCSVCKDEQHFDTKFPTLIYEEIPGTKLVTG